MSTDFNHEYRIATDEPGKRSRSLRGGFVVASQIVQELPSEDQQAWRKEMLAPENSFERSERLARQEMASDYLIVPGLAPEFVEMPRQEAK